MKVKPIFLVDERARKTAMSQLMDAPTDGTMKVTFSGAKGKSARQRGLQWMWYEDVVKSGIGGRDEADENRLHLVSKYRWCLPIQIRDDDHMADLWLAWNRAHQHDPAALEWFVAHHVSTEKLDQSPMAEYLTKFQEHYAGLGVNLRDPADFGWANLLEHDGQNTTRRNPDDPDREQRGNQRDLSGSGTDLPAPV